jgi:hypothetical protein
MQRGEKTVTVRRLVQSILQQAPAGFVLIGALLRMNRPALAAVSLVANAVLVALVLLRTP